VRANWQRINVAVHQALSQITLADMAFPGTADLVSIARSIEEAERMRAAGPQSKDAN
jgi:DNA-binding IscR family transcriptional regulator